MVAQIDEQNAAVVADAMAPAGEADLGADVGLAERAAGMGAVAVHARFRPRGNERVAHNHMGRAKLSSACTHGADGLMQAARYRLDRTPPICTVPGGKD